MELLEKHFETALESPGGIKKLRQLILTLVMQGKLVDQDPKDQPASELLKEIEAEKERLIKEGKLKKQKPLLEIKPEEVPYELPVGWVWVRNRDICHDWGQKKPDRKFEYIDVGSIDNSIGKLSNQQKILEAKEAPSRARKIVKYGTVLYSTVRPYLQNIAIINRKDNIEIIASTAFAVLHPFNQLNVNYVYNYLKSSVFTSFVEKKMKGVAYPAISDADFFKGVFPLPPLAEQKRIVTKINQLMALCDKLETEHEQRNQKQLNLHQASLSALTQARNPAEFQKAWSFVARHFDSLYSVKENVAELKKAILTLAMQGKLVEQDPNDQPAEKLLEEIRAQKEKLIKEGKLKKQKPLPGIKPEEVPYELPAGWVWCRLGEVFDITSGITLGRKTKISDPITLPYLRVANVQRGYLKLDHLKEIIIDEIELSKYQIRTGDLLITEGGDWDKVGRTCIWNDEVEKCLHQNHIFKARKIISCWNPKWTELYLNSNVARQYFANSAKQTTNLASINMTQLKNCLVIIPPLTEQERIIAKIDQLMKLSNQLENQLIESNEKQTAFFDAVLAKV